MGRGGAAFPTGVKWEAVAHQAARPHYLICNADESEPGHVQGPRRDRGRSVLADRGHDDRGVRHRLRARLRLPARRVPAGARHPGRGDRRGAPARLPRRRRAGRGIRVRHRDPQGRRRLHLRRGDRDLQLDRGLPRRAALQAAVPGGRGPVRQADRRQQRRDPGQRAPGRARERAGLRRDGHRGVERDEALLPLGQRRAPGRLRGAVRDDAERAARPGRGRRGRARAAGRADGRRGRRLPAARRARPAAHVRGRARGQDDARLGRRAGARRPRRPAALPAAHRRLLPQRVVRSVRARAASARCASRRRWRGSSPDGRAAAREAELALVGEIGQCMRDASICGLGQTASSAIESAIGRLGVFGGAK